MPRMYMYKCANCGNLTPSAGRTKKRVIMTRPDGSKKQYDVNVCQSCYQAETEGKDLKQLKGPTSRSDDGQNEPASTVDDIADAPAAKTSGVPARRSHPSKDQNSSSGRRSRSTTSGAR